MKKYINNFIKLFKIYILKDKFLLSAKRWFADDGDNTLRLEYLLDNDSIVFDIGGYEGKYAEAIYHKYKCNIYVFEPVNDFYNKIVNKFNAIDKIKIFKFGLSNENKKLLISLGSDASSIYTNKIDKEKIILKSIIEFIDESNISYINLMKINIEGGEYEVLPALIESKMIDKIENIQIQFHNFIPNAENKRKIIRDSLSKTHKLTYDYYFIWENWKLKK